MPTRQSLFLHSFAQSIVALTIGAVACGFSDTARAQDTESAPVGIASDLFQFAPESPEQLVEAAMITRGLGREDDARKFLRKLLEKLPSDSELKTLRERAGSEPFLTLSGDRKMQPEGSELLQVVNAATKPKALSSTELQELIQKLGKPGEDATAAAVTLAANGNESAAALLAADPATPAGRIAHQLLIDNARDMRFGLLSELSNSDSNAVPRILELLGTTADSEIAPALLRWQFDPNSDSTTHATAARAIAQLTLGRLEVATANEASNYLVERSVALLRSAADRFQHTRVPASLRELGVPDRPAEMLRKATAYLSDATTLDPSNATANELLLVARCGTTNAALTEAPSVAAGKPLQELATAFHAALELNDATAGIELLRAIKVHGFSIVDGAAQSVLETSLKTAVNSPDPRIRILAADVAINHANTHVSSPAVSRTLTSVRMGSLKPEAVVVDSDDRNLRNLDVALENAGFAVAVSQTGQDGFDAAVHQMNCELIVVDAESAGWPLATTLANLRSDIRTRKTPIVVVGPERFAKRVEHLGEIHPGVWFVAEPVGIESLALTLEALRLPGYLLTAEDRVVMKQLAGNE